jgi:hypothetical protein
MITGTVIRISLDNNKNRSVDLLIVRFLENGLPEKHLVMEAER